MAVLPAFYIDNLNVDYDETIVTRGNRVSDLYSDGNVSGIKVSDVKNWRAKNNIVSRLRSDLGIAFEVDDIQDVLMLYNVASRCNRGFEFTSVATLNVYNATTHNCKYHFITNGGGTFRNIALSAYEDHNTYKNCTGFICTSGTVDLDYALYFNLGYLYNDQSKFFLGSNIEEKEILYLNEPEDDLTPDHISELVNSGTDNSLRIEDPCIGGIESKITDEVTASRTYQFELIDNSFWDVENPKSGEMSLIAALQSRILASSELFEKETERDFYIKTAESILRFSELYPMSQWGSSPSKFKKRVIDMWYAGQNPGTLAAYNNAIGGYTLLPSFFKRLEDVDDSWIVGGSYVGYNNYLLGNLQQYYGIGIDILGLSTLSTNASAECYNNVQNSVADIGPVEWILHDEVQPDGYFVFTDMYNRFEDCSLSNMVYNDDFNISIDEVQKDCSWQTPVISTETIGVSGQVEVSFLERIYSENIIRNLYYRTGANPGTMNTWQSLDKSVSAIISINDAYVQFKAEISGVLRQIDYEFIGLAIKAYSSSREWSGHGTN